MPTKTATKKVRKTGSAKRHEVNRGELDPLKAEVVALKGRINRMGRVYTDAVANLRRRVSDLEARFHSQGRGK
jgi:hypothetical protein